MSFAVPIAADSVAARAGIGAAADGLGATSAKTAAPAAAAGSGTAKTSRPDPATAAPKAAPKTARRRPPAQAKTPRPTLSPPRGRVSGWSPADGAGFLMGLVLFALGTSYLRYGPAGVRAWFGAKFINKVDPVIAAGEAARGITPAGQSVGQIGGGAPAVSGPAGSANAAERRLRLPAVLGPAGSANAAERRLQRLRGAR